MNTLDSPSLFIHNLDMKQIALLLVLVLFGCGKDGAQGPAGKDGSNYDIVSYKHCFTTSLSLAFEYNITELPNNNYFVWSGVSGSTTASESRYFKSTNINDLGQELLYYTIPGDTNPGAWTFTNQNGSITVRYSSTGSTNDGFSFVFTSGNCT